MCFTPRGHPRPSVEGGMFCRCLLGSTEPRLWVCCVPPPGLLDLGQTFLHSFIPLQEVALLLMREFKTPSSQSEISLRRSLFTWLVLRCQ